ncbi:hypothetical protein ACFPK9_05155 [Rubritalea spongiae]|uniref:CorA-like Mg2+ transporter protein n=1 Tax=Rubritalea spongiae TaxID=430797 RepID=A0ABW5E7G0_9BACT
MQAVSTRKSIIPKSWNVSPTIRHRVGEDVGRQRLIEEDGQILVILHQVPNVEEKSLREAALFWCDEAGDWKSLPSSGGKSELKTLVNDYQRKFAELDQLLESAEDPAVIHDVIDNATPVLRAGRHATQVLSELRKALRDDLDILATRDLAVNMERNGDLLLQDAKSSLEYLIAKNAAAQAKDAQKAAKEAQKLNRLAAFFFPLMTLAAILGMNAPSTMLGNGNIWLVVVVGLALGGIVRAVLKGSE